MDRRIWRRQRGKSPIPSGETDSSGSLSSHSDDQTLSNHHDHSPEVRSKSPPREEEHSPSVKEALAEKLSEALLTIRAKEDLVKQHARVAEEAVSGWERAENEVLALKKLNDALNQENLVLDERVGHLDGALKECLRQLRQAREEQEEKIYDAIAKKNSEWESKTFELETQLAELHSQLESAKVSSLNADVCSKLEAAEKENSILKLQLLSQDRELDRRASERDLSIQTAENASKLYLDSIKKVAKLEAECRRLKAVARKAGVLNNSQSATESSVCAESFTDSQSDNGERMLYIDNDFGKLSIPDPTDNGLCGANADSTLSKDGTTLDSIIVPSSVEIDMMDDFLEMERLAAACPCPEETQTGSEGAFSARKVVQCEVDSAIKDLEENLKCMTADKLSLKIALDKCQIQLKESKEHLKRSEEKLVNVEKQLTLANQQKTELTKQLADSVVKIENLTELLDEAEKKIERFQDQLTDANAAKNIAEMQFQDASKKKAEAESDSRVIELELRTLNSNLSTLKEEVETEKEASKKAAATCSILEGELSKLKSDHESQASAFMEQIRFTKMQLEDASLKKVEAERQVNETGIKLRTLQSSIFKLERQVEKENQFSREAAAKCRNLEAEISRMQQDCRPHKPVIFTELRLTQEKELEVAASKFAECQKTIASLTRQLKSLAVFDDPLIESQQPLAAVL